MECKILPTAPIILTERQRSFLKSLFSFYKEMFATENDNRELFTKAKVPLFITSVWLTQQLGKFPSSLLLSVTGYITR